MPTWVPTVSVDDVEDEDVVPFHHGGVDYAIYRSHDGELADGVVEIQVD